MPTTSPPRATDLTDRALGPDLARGVMLLFIALANSHYFIAGGSYLGGFPRDGSGIDRIVTWAIVTFVDGRAFPMFGLLFGYGVAQIAARQAARGPGGVRRLLWRRAGALIAIGFVHAMLLFVGDILAAYGVLLLLGAWAVRWRDRWLLVVALMFFTLTALPSPDSGTISTVGPDPSMLPTDLLSSLAERIVVQPYIALLGPVGFACPFLLGLWIGRRRVLEQPERHVRLLTVLAGAGIGAAILGAQPVALVVSGVSDVPGQDVLNIFGTLHDATGVAGGIGFAALLALVAMRLAAHDQRPRVVEALAATGQRSMTCYLAQSVVWTLVFTPYLLDLSGRLTATTCALLAAATWLTTVALADRMQRAGERGPFERLVRRVTYGSRAGS